jgi:effector-binding domain-containing protein
MIDAPHITTTSPQHTAFIRLQVSLEEMQQVFGPVVGELIAIVANQGIALAGPVFAHHLSIDCGTDGVPSHFDFELSVPIATPVTAAGRVKPGVWPAMKVAHTIHHGPYEGLPDAWGSFMDWIHAEGLTPALDLYESYVTGPHSDPDPMMWRTELTRPLLT